MATEKLVLELNAKVDKAIKDLDEVKKTLGETEEESNKLSDSFKAVGGAASTMAKAALAAAAAITAIAVATAKADRTMGNLAVTAKMSKEEFKGLAFAFSQFDVDAKGAADALNDVSERLGEFAATFAKDGKGSGAFQDFADTMKLSDEAAGAFATTLEDMAPEDAIVAMVAAMEDAGIKGSRMSWVLKSISNDLEYTSQLFGDNGKKLKGLKGAYAAMSKELQLTAQQSADITELAGSFDLLTVGIGDAAAKITSTGAGAFTPFFNAIIDILPDATNAIINFINRWREASSLSSIIEIDAQIALELEKIERNTDRVTRANRAWDASKTDATAHEWNAALNEEAEITGRINELSAQRVLILKEQKDAEIELLEAKGGGVIGGNGVDGVTAHSEELSEYEQFLENKAKLDRQYAAFFNKLRASEDRIASAALQKESNQKEAALNAGLGAAKAVNSALLDDNKLVGAGLIVADTAIGMMKAMAQQGAYGFATAAAIGVMGAAQLANLNSAGRGGGGITGAVSTPTLEPIDLPGQDDQVAGASISATDASGAGAFASNITLEIDGEVIASIVYDNIAKLEQDGVIS